MPDGRRTGRLRAPTCQGRGEGEKPRQAPATPPCPAPHASDRLPASHPCSERRHLGAQEAQQEISEQEGTPDPFRKCWKEGAWLAQWGVSSSPTLGMEI